MTAAFVCLTLSVVALAEVGWVLWFTRDRRPKGLLEGFMYDMGQGMRYASLVIGETLMLEFHQFATWLADNHSEIEAAAASLADTNEATR